jgi:hypothetical protein
MTHKLIQDSLFLPTVHHWRVCHRLNEFVFLGESCSVGIQNVLYACLILEEKGSQYDDV